MESRLDFKHDGDKSEYMCELALVAHRSTALAHVMKEGDKAGAELKEYLNAFQNSDGRSSTNYEGEGLDLSREKTAEKLSHAPPSLGAQNLLSFEELGHLARLEGISGKIEAPVETNQSLTSYEEKVSVHFNAVSELLKSVKSATADLHEARVVKQAEIARQKKAKEAEEAKLARSLTGKKMKKDRAAQPPAEEDTRAVFQAKHSELPVIPVVTEEAFKQLSCADPLVNPYIIRPATSMAKLRDADAGLRKELADNRAKFSHDVNRAKGLRNDVADSSVRAVLQASLMALLPNSCHREPLQE